MQSYLGKRRSNNVTAKHTGNKQPFDVGLGRKGAVRQRKEEVVEQYGHKFVQQQFYNVMRCALCGEFLKYAAGMQCSDCNYTCHKKCYPKVVTKCITQSNAETDPDEAKLNHRIPHRFENFSNMGANWCCHCGYILPLGRKQTKKCTGTQAINIWMCSVLTIAQNAASRATRIVCILYPTSAVCQWK
jgi:classical protein kinase C